MEKFINFCTQTLWSGFVRNFSTRMHWCVGTILVVIACASYIVLLIKPHLVSYVNENFLEVVIAMFLIVVAFLIVSFVMLYLFVMWQKVKNWFFRFKRDTLSKANIPLKEKSVP